MSDNILPPKRKHNRGLPKAAEKYKFKPGVSGNPAGRPPLKPIQRALRNLTIETYREVIEAVCTGNIDNLKGMIMDPKTSALQVGIATALVKAIDAGDYATIERIAERIVGKIPDELNIHAKTLNANLNAVVDKAEVKAAIAAIQADV